MVNVIPPALPAAVTAGDVPFRSRVTVPDPGLTQAAHDLGVVTWPEPRRTAWTPADGHATPDDFRELGGRIVAGFDIIYSTTWFEENISRHELHTILVRRVADRNGR